MWKDVYYYMARQFTIWVFTLIDADVVTKVNVNANDTIVVKVFSQLGAVGWNKTPDIV